MFRRIGEYISLDLFHFCQPHQQLFTHTSAEGQEGASLTARHTHILIYIQSSHPVLCSSRRVRVTRPDQNSVSSPHPLPYSLPSLKYGWLLFVAVGVVCFVVVCCSRACVCVCVWRTRTWCFLFCSAPPPPPRPPKCTWEIIKVQDLQLNRRQRQRKTDRERERESRNKKDKYYTRRDSFLPNLCAGCSCKNRNVGHWTGVCVCVCVRDRHVTLALD